MQKSNCFHDFSIVISICNFTISLKKTHYRGPDANNRQVMSNLCIITSKWTKTLNLSLLLKKNCFLILIYRKPYSSLDLQIQIKQSPNKIMEKNDKEILWQILVQITSTLPLLLLLNTACLKISSIVFGLTQ